MRHEPKELRLMGVRWDDSRPPRDRDDHDQSPADRERARWSDHHYIGAAVGVIGGSILTFVLLTGTEAVFGEDPEPRVITRTSEVEVEVERVPKNLMVIAPGTPLLIDGQEYACEWEGELGGRVEMVTCTAKEK